MFVDKDVADLLRPEKLLSDIKSIARNSKKEKESRASET
jgi:hypothetical protein